MAFVDFAAPLFVLWSVAPVFYPTIEEFKDPIEYISRSDGQ